MSETMEMTRITVDGVEKFAINYPLTDENNQPILDRNGKPRVTHLVAESAEELVKKMALANMEIARTLERANRHIDTLKNKKPTARPAPVDMSAKPLTQEEKVQIGLDTQDPRKAADAIQRVVESVVPVAKITGEVERQGKTIDVEARTRIAREFINAHKEDYYPIAANNLALNKHLAENGLEFSVDNLEIAMARLQGSLAARPPVPTTVNNEPPSNDLPGNEPPNPGTPPPQPRRAPVGGIRDSQVSGRPSSEPTLTKAQALEMLYKRPHEYEEWMRDPKRYPVLNRALAGH
jgi:hypothetical protein